MNPSRPTAPDPILLLQDIAFALDKQGSESWAIICREAATALSLAQTEIKGHMRMEEELKKDNKLWHANWEAAHAEVQEARDFIVEQSKGNLGGGERPVEFLLASYKLMAHERAQAQARIAVLEEELRSLKNAPA